MSGLFDRFDRRLEFVPLALVDEIFPFRFHVVWKSEFHSVVVWCPVETGTGPRRFHGNDVNSRPQVRDFVPMTCGKRIGGGNSIQEQVGTGYGDVVMLQLKFHTGTATPRGIEYLYIPGDDATIFWPSLGRG